MLAEAFKSTIKGFGIQIPSPSPPEVRKAVSLDKQSNEDKEFVCNGLK